RSCSFASNDERRVCFFFQAEDGIRDFHVTGVQTCALPISEMNFAVNTEVVEDGIAVIDLKGEVDLYTAPEFKQHLLGQVENGVRSEERRVGNARSGRGSGRDGGKRRGTGEGGERRDGKQAG